MVPGQHTGHLSKPDPVRRRCSRRIPIATLAAVALSLTSCGQNAPVAQQRPQPPSQPSLTPPPQSWVTSAAQPMSIVRPAPAFNETCRQVLRSTSASPQLRVRLSNATSSTQLTLTAVTIARRARGPAVSDPQTLSLRGSATIAIPAGAFITTDPVRLPVSDGDDLAVSFAVAGTASLSAHLVGAATGWCTGSGTGDHTRDATGAAFVERARLGLVAEALEVDGRDGILAIGDSLTDPPLPPDSYLRWSDVLAAHTNRPVANVGIGGNRTLLPGGYGATLVERFDRDVLSRPGATAAILFTGTNDISAGASAADLQRAMTELCRRLRQRHLRVVLVTIAPAHKRTADREQVRQALNAWIRTTPEADVRVDADALLRDPARPTRLLPSYDLGDGLHLSAAGHRALGLAMSQLL